MTNFEIILVAFSLAMDALAVSVGKGLSLREIRPKPMLICGIWFGGSQLLMSLIGFYLGTFLSSYISQYNYWAAFILLVLIGGNMIRKARNKKQDADPDVAPAEMFRPAVETGIGALAAGAAYAFLYAGSWRTSVLIGVLAFFLSMAGVRLGSTFGDKYRPRAELAGGLILCVIGLRILLSELGVAYF